MKNINVLCYNSKNKLVMITTSKDIQKGEIVAFEGNNYKATNIRKGINTLSNKDIKIIDLQEWKEKNNEKENRLCN